MEIKIALAGNPNVGKTTLFNALTGSNQFVGNWAGVTVEHMEGELKGHPGVILTDLPGVYSLSPYTLEEVVARNYLIDSRPSAVINIIDGTNIERNLYLTTQIVELGIPVIAAVNMMDVVEKNGDSINFDELERDIGCKFVKISALKGEGIDEAASLAADIAREGKRIVPKYRFSDRVERALKEISDLCLGEISPEQKRWYAIKLFERDEKLREKLKLPEDVLLHIEELVSEIEAELDDDAESVITNERYNFITSIIDRCYTRKNPAGTTYSDKIDDIVTNRFLALPIFAAVMAAVYYVSIVAVGGLSEKWMNEGLFGKGFHLFGIDSIWIPGVPVLVERGLDAVKCAAWLKGLVLDGIVAGVSAVLGFVPQMFALFIFLAFFEACGYMSRVAFIMDKLFRKFGLSGKSFIPMLIGTGCGVPGIMASRTIENLRDRRMTIITTTFIPCGAKLPVIALISSALFGGAWWVAPSAYFVGIAAVIISGVCLKKTRPFLGEPAPFVMELPAYHMPTAKTVFGSMWERGWSYIKKAGTVILLASIAVWAGSRFGWINGSFGFDADLNLTDSILGKVGNGLKIIFKPLGFGSETAAVATIMGLLAKEEIVGVFGVLKFTGFTALSGYSFLVFNLLCAPCCAAMAAIRREMGSAKWTIFALSYQCIFAYAVSLCIYQIGMAVSGSPNVFGLIAAAAVIAFIGFMFFKPYQESGRLTKSVKIKE